MSANPQCVECPEFPCLVHGTNRPSNPFTYLKKQIHQKTQDLQLSLRETIDTNDVETELPSTSSGISKERAKKKRQELILRKSFVARKKMKLEKKSQLMLRKIQQRKLNRAQFVRNEIMRRLSSPSAAIISGHMRTMEVEMNRTQGIERSTETSTIGSMELMPSTTVTSIAEANMTQGLDLSIARPLRCSTPTVEKSEMIVSINVPSSAVATKNPIIIYPEIQMNRIQQVERCSSPTVEKSEMIVSLNMPSSAVAITNPIPIFPEVQMNRIQQVEQSNAGSLPTTKVSSFFAYNIQQERKDQHSQTESAEYPIFVQNLSIKEESTSSENTDFQIPEDESSSNNSPLSDNIEESVESGSTFESQQQENVNWTDFPASRIQNLQIRQDESSATNSPLSDNIEESVESGTTFESQQQQNENWTDFPASRVQIRQDESSPSINPDVGRANNSLISDNIHAFEIPENLLVESGSTFQQIQQQQILDQRCTVIKTEKIYEVDEDDGVFRSSESRRSMFSFASEEMKEDVADFSYMCKDSLDEGQVNTTDPNPPIESFFFSPPRLQLASLENTPTRTRRSPSPPIIHRHQTSQGLTPSNLLPEFPRPIVPSGNPNWNNTSGNSWMGGRIIPQNIQPRSTISQFPYPLAASDFLKNDNSSKEQNFGQNPNQQQHINETYGRQQSRQSTHTAVSLETTLSKLESMVERYMTMPTIYDTPSQNIAHQRPNYYPSSIPPFQTIRQQRPIYNTSECQNITTVGPNQTTSSIQDRSMPYEVSQNIAVGPYMGFQNLQPVTNTLNSYAPTNVTGSGPNQNNLVPYRAIQHVESQVPRNFPSGSSINPNATMQQRFPPPPPPHSHPSPYVLPPVNQQQMIVGFNKIQLTSLSMSPQITSRAIPDREPSQRYENVTYSTSQTTSSRYAPTFCPKCKRVHNFYDSC